MLFNLHTHTQFSDGSDEPSKYVEEAIRQGFHTLGFSDHSPVPFENNFAIREGEMGHYVDTILSLREKYASSDYSNDSVKQGESAALNILLGLEIDYIPGITTSFSEYRENYPFDYLIGSVHLVRNGSTKELWFIDGPDIQIYDKGLKDIFQGDIRKGVTAYYNQLNDMILHHSPDIVGHLDKIKMYNRNRYFQEDDEWYVNLVDETLELIREKGCVAEVNTRGIYKKRSDSLFPGPAILEKIHKLNIPVTLTSDAHRPEELSYYFKETREILSGIGFTAYSVRTFDGWKEIPLL